MTLRHRQIDAGKIPDVGTRIAMRELAVQVQSVVEHLNGAMDTDFKKGRVFLKGSLVLPDAGHNPTLQSTFGRPGELIRFEERLFTKAGAVESEDTNWNELPTTGYVLTSRQVIAGNGITGGGDLSLDRTFTLGTPSTITESTTNSVGASTHEHAITGFSEEPEVVTSLPGSGDYFGQHIILDTVPGSGPYHHYLWTKTTYDGDKWEVFFKAR